MKANSFHQRLPALTAFAIFLVGGLFAAERPNIVLILADDLGWADTTLYGKTSLCETPNIERLTKRGMTFTNACASPICSPTRASLMSGQNPARPGMTAPAANLPEVRFDPIANTTGLPVHPMMLSPLQRGCLEWLGKISSQLRSS